jgi:hypothetical protein
MIAVFDEYEHDIVAFEKIIKLHRDLPRNIIVILSMQKSHGTGDWDGRFV